MCPFERDQFLGERLAFLTAQCPTGSVWTQIFKGNASRHKLWLPNVQNNVVKFAFTLTTPTVEQMTFNNPQAGMFVALEDLGPQIFLPVWALNGGATAVTAVDIYWK